MAITTTQEKFSVLDFNDWTHAAIPQSADGLGSDDQKWFLHGFPTQVWTDVHLPCKYYDADAYYDALLGAVDSGSIGSMWGFFDSTDNPVPDESAVGTDFPLPKFSGSTNPASPLIADGRASTRSESSASWRISGASAVPFQGSLVGSCGVMLKNISGLSTLFQYFWGAGGGSLSRSLMSLSFSGGNVELRLIVNASTVLGTIAFAIPTTPATTNPTGAYRYDVRWKLGVAAPGGQVWSTYVELFVDGVSAGTITADRTGSTAWVVEINNLFSFHGGPTTAEFEYGYNSDVYFEDALEAELQAAYLQSQIAYIDPDPFCILQVGQWITRYRRRGKR